MKFGKYLATRSLELPEYSGHFINYKALKKLINQLAIQDDSLSLQDKKGSFFFKVERELEKVNEFYLEKQSELRIKLDILMMKKNKLFNQSSVEKSSIDFISLYESLKKFSSDLDRLQQFVELNEAGFTKVLKKWDKRSKSTTKELYLSIAVNVQPVFHRNEIIELSDLVATNLLELEAQADGDVIIRYEKQATKAIPSSKSDRLFDQLIFMIKTVDPSVILEKLTKLFQSFLDENNSDNISFKLSNLLYLLTLNENVSNEIILHFINFFSNLNFSMVDDLTGRNFLHQLVISKVDRYPVLDQIVRNPDFDPSTLPVIKDFNGRTPLHYVAEAGNLNTLQLLLQYTNIKLVIDALDGNSMCALLLAVINRHIDILQLLLANGSNPFPTQSEVQPVYLPLNIACQLGDEEIVKILLSSTKHSENQLNNFFQCNAEGLLPLHIVASLGNHNLITLLLDHGADVNQLDKLNKWTPMFYAVIQGNPQTVELLIANGADFKLRDDDNLDPLYYAVLEGNVYVMNVLLKYLKDEPDKKLTPSKSQGPEKPHLTPSVLSISSVPSSVTDLIPDLSLPPPIIPLRKYGHNFLEKKIFLKFNFFTARDSLKINPDTFLTSVPGRLTVSFNKDDLIPRNLILPISSKENTIALQVDSLDDIMIDFELYPTFGTRLIAKSTLSASLLLSRYNKETDVYISLPLFDVRLRNIGQLQFSYQVIFPYSGKPLEISIYETYWKSTNNQSSQQLVKSTYFSFVTASSLSGQYYRVKVFLSHDGIPLVAPEWYLELAPNLRVPISNFTYSQLKVMLLHNHDIPERTANVKDFKQLEILLDQLKCIPLQVLLENLPINLSIDLEIFYPTLYELTFADLPLARLNVKGNELILKTNEINYYTDTILTTVFDHVRSSRQTIQHDQKTRSMIFSSSNPSICTILNWKQPNYPVLFNMSGVVFDDEEKTFKYVSANGFPILEDFERTLTKDRSNIKLDNIDSINKKESNSYTDELVNQHCISKSIKQAVFFATSNNLLGIIVSNQLLKVCPRLIEDIRSRGLILVASENNKTPYDIIDDVNGLRLNDILTFQDDIDM
ncbi:Cyclin-dependent kinase (CDK) inhibitor [Komagataella phaffii CBS 7435]|uniref:Uncharacterized protein n=2 Tax=Komagataella phaffii TaxID=460519 RepID=C4QZ55_KOMPG|nr:Hypothetical protein PAS_c121_0015 [Komagataella phaffii GS115]AOA61360.1 GQ67_01467T0 [Komagataella phaffii]CAH2447357.1 Cyclin-dependent kinase (CDK) inhibitor [Komagataella phaffii CBS 7435]AOA66780.1 GQ68_01483T0 [Komagataella phaffii GS115]CAY68529.1 Hypothetical protein PAS_c121_0015 [Komagataella phaffii GS115]CCA37591.1 Cyclin-dependent kinase (CDK) inhibitor [Komagataella phaffii CBS 7435]